MLTRRRRRLLVAGVLVALAAALGVVGWLAVRTPPLTAEEQRFAGWWTAPDWGRPNPAALDPSYQTAVEYRADRTIRSRWVDPRTGRVWFKVSDSRWHVDRGELVAVCPRTDREAVNSLLGRGDRLRYEYAHQVTWDGPDRYTYRRTRLPDGVWWPEWEHVRCAPPADAPP